MSRDKRQKPDEILSRGPIVMTRYRTTTVVENHMSETQHAKAKDALVVRHPTLCSEIDDLVARIRSLVVGLEPLALLTRAAWGVAHAKSKHTPGKDADVILAQQTVEYLQSVVVATDPPASQLALDDSKWSALQELLKQLYGKLQLEFLVSDSCYREKYDPKFDAAIEDAVAQLQMRWLMLRGHRFFDHEVQRIRELLDPHNAVINELFGVSAREVIRGLEKLLRSLALGCEDVASDLRTLHTEFVAKADAAHLVGTLPANPIELVDSEPDLRDRLSNVFGRLMGADLFDVQKVTELPTKFLEELALGPGQDAELFATGTYCGWPLRVLPTWRRPFLHLGGRYYCFDVHGLFDHFYRAIQRMIRRMKPSYDVTWKEKQTIVSEALPFAFLGKLLPGAVAHRSIYYLAAPNAGGVREWCEADGALVFDDYLLVVEVKGGAFPVLSPTLDVIAYRKSVEELIRKPTIQAHRLLQTLDMYGSVTFCDMDHKPIQTISRSQFNAVYAICVTLDSVAQLSVQANRLVALGIDVQAFPTWILTIDDLRVCSELLCQPFELLHFLSCRLEASRIPELMFIDEIDHVGVYLTHGRYSSVGSSAGKKVTRQLIGFDREINEYYANRVINPAEARVPGKRFPSRILEILEHLQLQRVAGRTSAALQLIDLGHYPLGELSNGIDACLEKQSETTRRFPLSLPGDSGIVVCISQDGILARDSNLARGHAFADMLVRQRDRALLFEISYDASGKLRQLDFSQLARTDITNAQRSEIDRKASEIRRRRVTGAQKNESVNRNDLCPCASGLKYKKCCLLRGL